MEEKNKKNEELEKFDIANAACIGECTGLIQQIPLTEEEFASYHAIYDYGPAETD